MYFVSSRGLAEFSAGGSEESEDGWVVVRDNRRKDVGKDEDWYGDKVDVYVGDGKVYLQFLDEPEPFGRRREFWRSLWSVLGCQ